MPSADSVRERGQEAAHTPARAFGRYRHGRGHICASIGIGVLARVTVGSGVGVRGAGKRSTTRLSSAAVLRLPRTRKENSFIRLSIEAATIRVFQRHKAKCIVEFCEELGIRDQVLRKEIRKKKKTVAALKKKHTLSLPPPLIIRHIRRSTISLFSLLSIRIIRFRFSTPLRSPIVLLMMLQLLARPSVLLPLTVLMVMSMMRRPRPRRVRGRRGRR